MNLKAGKTPFMIPAHLIDQSGVKVEDHELSWILDQARLWGFDEVQLPPMELGSEYFDVVNDQILAKKLTPHHYISSKEFALENLTPSLQQGVHFVIMIYEPLTASFLHRLNELIQFRDQFKFVLIVRKDWNFLNTFKSIPHKMRENLFIDFPAKLHHGDAFYSPHQVLGILDKLSKNFPHFLVRSYSPNAQFYRQLQSSYCMNASQVKLDESKKITVSIVTTNPETVLRLNSIESLRKCSDRVEIILARMAGEKTQIVAEMDITVSKLWLHRSSEDQSGQSCKAQLRNLGASRAQGQTLVFLENESSDEIEKLFVDIDNLERRNWEAYIPVFQKEYFIKCGGFDPVYSFFGLDILELEYKYQAATNVQEPLDLFKYVSKEVLPELRDMGARLFYSQYLNYEVYQQLCVSPSKLQVSQKERKKPWINSTLKYRMIRIKDAYLSLYKATPKVAIEGNIKFLWSFLKPYLLKTYFILHRLYFDYIFRALFPVRKIYYMFEYQYEKRILGLHGRKHDLKRVKN